MKLLLHICCAPCSTYTIPKIIEKGIDVTGYFYNPNIHPYQEFKKRLNTFFEYADSIQLAYYYEPDYGLVSFLREVVFHESTRCPICYQLRLEQTARRAAKFQYDGFSTTLLYSRFQNHELIVRICEKLSLKYGIEFYYDDFRLGWQQGIDSAIELELYRQRYCGCIYSEQERFDNRLKKRLRNERKKSINE